MGLYHYFVYNLDTAFCEICFQLIISPFLIHALACHWVNANNNSMDNNTGEQGRNVLSMVSIISRAIAYTAMC